MDKNTLIAILKKVLGTDEDVEFLRKLDEAELVMLVTLVREKMGSSKIHCSEVYLSPNSPA